MNFADSFQLCNCKMSYCGFFFTDSRVESLSLSPCYVSMLSHLFQMWFSVSFDVLWRKSWHLFLYFHVSELFYPNLVLGQKSGFYFPTWFNRTLFNPPSSGGDRYCTFSCLDTLELKWFRYFWTIDGGSSLKVLINKNSTSFTLVWGLISCTTLYKSALRDKCWLNISTANVSSHVVDGYQ